MYFKTHSHVPEVVLLLLLRNLRFVRLNTCPPPIPTRNMLPKRSTLSTPSIKVLPISATFHLIIIPEQTPLPQFRNQQLNHIHKSTGLNRIRDIKPIDICFFYPAFKLICYLCWCADDGSTKTANADMPCNGSFCPFRDSWRGLGPGFYCGSKFCK